MKAVIQVVKEASVTVQDAVCGRIGPGMLVLLGVARGDSPRLAELLARKIAGLRIYPDDEGKLNRSLLETGGEALVVSNFTLYGDSRQGRRPSYINAAPPDEARGLYEAFCQALLDCGVPKVQQGVFGADMLVSLCNDGPTTLVLDTAELFPNQ